jgi:hypothetical protein
VAGTGAAVTDVAQKARAILAREGKVPPRERFRRMVASGLINQDGSYRGPYHPYDAGVIEGERRMRLKVRAAQQQALRELRELVEGIISAEGRTAAVDRIASIDRATRAPRRGRVPR